MLFKYLLASEATGDEFSSSTSMWVEGENHYVGEIPAFESGTTVYFKVRVHSDAGIFESQIGFYTVQSDERDLLILVIALSATGLIVVVIGRIFVRRRK